MLQQKSSFTGEDILKLLEDRVNARYGIQFWPGRDTLSMFLPNGQNFEVTIREVDDNGNPLPDRAPGYKPED